MKYSLKDELLLRQCGELGYAFLKLVSGNCGAEHLGKFGAGRHWVSKQD